MTTRAEGTWVPVCAPETIPPSCGVAALLAGNTQVAVFRTGDGEFHALSNIDPFSGAAVLSRGIVGDLRGTAVVFSPLYKQSFELGTGRCVDDPDVAVPVYPVRVEGGAVQVRSP